MGPAEAGPVDPGIERARAAALAEGPEAYAALRELWRGWDVSDPAQVEEALSLVAESAKRPPLRVYASLLSAYARRRRGDLDGALARVKELGFASRFAVVGPFDNDHKAGFARALEPEAELGAPPDLTKTYAGKERRVSWRVPPETPSYGWVDFGDYFRPREGVCGIASAYVRLRKGARPGARQASVWVGAAGAFKLFWDEALVLEDAEYRQLDADRFAAPVVLRAPAHRITIKVCASGESPKFALRVGKPDGSPDPDLEIVPAPPEAPAGPTPAGAGKARPGRASALGPVQAFEARLAGKGGAPASLEAYARYLHLTGGEPEGTHKARDLARRAAEAEPTTARLLLAAQLAEDENGRRALVGRARKLAGRGSKDVELLLAEAAVLRASVNWRDAVPVFEKVLALEPDNVLATLGLVELHVEAGLRRTALAELEAASARKPHSVALLRALAAQLRALGRDVEADETASRYAALRFDDTGHLMQLVELAQKRRDVAGAERWIERLVSSETDAGFALGLAAKAYRALGQKERSLGTYARALEIAPEDTGLLRALADLHGSEGRREEEMRLLRKVLALNPQAKDVREYLEHLEPPKPRADEAYAWAPSRFLPLAGSPRGKHPRRTLRNLTVSTVFSNGLSSKFRQVVFQPMTDEAAAQARQYGFTYEGGKQAVTLRAARVFRKDGKVDEAIESGEAPVSDPSLNMYTSQRSFLILLPKLAPGDVVELRYRVDDVAPRNELGAHFGEIEYLQSDEPIASSEYVLISPKAKKLAVGAFRLPGLERKTRESGAFRIEHFVARDVPPVRLEPAMPPLAEVLGGIHVSTFSGWKDVGRFYFGLARPQLDADDEVRAVAREITKDAKSDLDKVRAVHEYATRTRYVALEFGIEGIRPRRSAQTLARGWGDCKDKAALTVSMLRELGIGAELVIVRTGMRGLFEPKPASLAPFDHAIAHVPSLGLYLDGTAEHTGTSELPAMDRGALALVVGEGKAELVRLPEPPPEASPLRRTVEITPAAAEGAASSFSVEIEAKGVFAPELRRRFVDENVRRDRLAQDLVPAFGPVEFAPGKAGLEVSDLEKVDQPVFLRAKGKAPSFGRREGERLSLPVSSSTGLASKFATLASREHDVVLPAKTLREESWTVKIPPGLRIVRAPEPASQKTAFGAFELSTEAQPGKLVVRTRLSLAKTRISPAEYPAFRAFCASADRALAQRLILGR